MLQTVISDIENNAIPLARRFACASSSRLNVERSRLGRTCHDNTGGLGTIIPFCQYTNVAEHLQQAAFVVMKELLTVLWRGLAAHHSCLYSHRLEGFRQVFRMCNRLRETETLTPLTVLEVAIDNAFISIWRVNGNFQFIQLEVSRLRMQAVQGGCGWNSDGP